MTLTIASVNVNGIRAACKQRNENNPGMNAWLEETSADIVLMQEVRATPQQAEKALAPALEAGWHLALADAAAKGRAGVGILSRTPLADVEVGFGSFSDAGRWVAATTRDIRVASLYLPSGDTDSPKLDEKYRFLDEFQDILADNAARTNPDGSPAEMVIGGDWNICHRAQDLKNNKANEKKAGHLPEERAFMDHVFGAFPDDEPQEKKNLGQWQGVVDYAGGEPWAPTTEPQWFDVARRLHPDEDGPYTWWTYRGQAFNNNAGWRIDYQAATRPMLERAQRTWVEKAPTVEQRWSDHSPLVVEYS
ncbi:exodeoxyribonuclease III [Corynebacterium kefirresidentii]|uniref:exodeoxyribonuclease III n=1 Tax=Corynebacterium TaxID=1716 RepID=UPI0003B85C46|nr:MULTISPECIES: exodeoxyribonuclease III [Corynebacterium]WKS54457.1 exodeoxyribonuclease III [Corynebacterium tuberculostearicum]ERS48926.1 exodeoxyribonuclease III [Corynebacterium sp. KPL1856]ERS49455.1 exodeoxyribonuclease III [Corynebacterium sp. KPL1860]ERS54134.1 exodeoxyribonuclease III [Corynebacterium sp. KPL1821]ERS60348.1 exodeoxyribonuclease III [Corynebacterium sp. KPL1817]